jgi:hypothetical protein
VAKYYAPIVPGTGVVELKNGGIVAPGTTVELKTDQIKENKDLIGEGSLVLMEKPEKGGDEK